MKTIMIRVPLALLLLLTSILGSSAQAAAVSGTVTAIYVFEVPPSQARGFVTHLKNLIGCIKSRADHSFTALTYTKMSERDVYIIVEPYRTWAALKGHRHDPAEGACVAMGLHLANFTKATGEIALINPALSYMADDSNPAPMLWVIAYRVKPGQRANFVDSQERFASAAAKVHWDAHFTGYDVYGAGRGGPTFLYVSPENSWTALVQNANSSAEHMMESAYGKAAAQTTYRKFADSVAEEWSDVWSLDKDLSYIPAK